MDTLKYHLSSKTTLGLVLFLSVIVGLSLLGKLTADVIEGLKWVSASFFVVRGVSNASENMTKKDDSGADK